MQKINAYRFDCIDDQWVSIFTKSMAEDDKTFLAFQELIGWHLILWNFHIFYVLFSYLVLLHQLKIVYTKYKKAFFHFLVIDDVHWFAVIVGLCEGNYLYFELNFLHFEQNCSEHELILSLFIWLIAVKSLSFLKIETYSYLWFDRSQ